MALRRVAIDTYRENVAYLHRECSVVRAEGFQALAKIEVGQNGERHILATLNVVDDANLVGVAEVGLSLEAFAQLGLPEGAKVTVAQAEPPESMGALRRKLSGERLRPQEFLGIVRDIAERHYS
ncbi:MAG: thymidine phosphorylase, partial [Tepidiphilus sp.]|nr:thymidine phosphorylase [Tepidiphilus sp.]